MAATLKALVKEYVRNGINMLDKHFPEWKDKIDLRTLDLSECDRCILGQLFGEYGNDEAEKFVRIINGITTNEKWVGAREAGMFGFDHIAWQEEYEEMDITEYYNLLTAAWVHAIKQEVRKEKSV